MRKLAFIAAGLATIAMAGVASGQTWPPLDTVPTVQKSNSDDVAVLVAVEDYAFLPDVPGARSNLADWEHFLVDGLGVQRTYMLSNHHAVREQILKAAERAAAEAKPGSTLWFLFIGHGAPNSSGTDGLLIGADGQQNPDSMNARGVAQQELIATLERGQQARTIVMLDACFSGRDATGRSLAEGTMPVLPTAAPKVAGQTVVMTAARADEFAGALPGESRPAFSYLLLGAMRGWADDGDGQVTTNEAVRFAARELLRVTDRQQTPQLFGSPQLVLARGVSESRPSAATTEASVAAVEPAKADVAPNLTATEEAATTEPTYVNDNIADALGFIKWNVGFSFGSEVSGEIPIASTWYLGLKLSKLYQKAVELRPFAFAHFFAERNPNLPEPGQTVTGSSGSYVVTGDEEDVEGKNIGIMAPGVGVGYAFRHEYGAGKDLVFDVGTGLGIAIPLAERCAGYENNF